MRKISKRLIGQGCSGVLLLVILFLIGVDTLKPTLKQYETKAGESGRLMWTSSATGKKFYCNYGTASQIKEEYNIICYNQNKDYITRGNRMFPFLYPNKGHQPACPSLSPFNFSNGYWKCQGKRGEYDIAKVGPYTSCWPVCIDGTLEQDFYLRCNESQKWEGYNSKGNWWEGVESPVCISNSTKGSLVPQNITASATGPNSIFVRFEKLKQNLNRVKEFLVSVNDTFFPMNKTLPRDENKVTFHNLASGTTHTVRVSTILTNGSLVPAEPVVTNTPVFIPGAPVNLTVIPHNKTCVNITWSKPEGDGIIRGYNIRSSLGHIQVIGSHYLMCNFDPRTMQCFNVSAYTASSRGNNSHFCINLPEEKWNKDVDGNGGVTVFHVTFIVAGILSVIGLIFIILIVVFYKKKRHIKNAKDKSNHIPMEPLRTPVVSSVSETATPSTSSQETDRLMTEENTASSTAGESVETVFTVENLDNLRNTNAEFSQRTDTVDGSAVSIHPDLVHPQRENCGETVTTDASSQCHQPETSTDLGTDPKDYVKENRTSATQPNEPVKKHLLQTSSTSQLSSTNSTEEDTVVKDVVKEGKELCKLSANTQSEVIPEETCAEHMSQGSNCHVGVVHRDTSLENHNQLDSLTFEPEPLFSSDSFDDDKHLHHLDQDDQELLDNVVKFEEKDEDIRKPRTRSDYGTAESDLNYKPEGEKISEPHCSTLTSSLFHCNKSGPSKSQPMLTDNQIVNQYGEAGLHKKSKAEMDSGSKNHGVLQDNSLCDNVQGLNANYKSQPCDSLKKSSNKFREGVSDTRSNMTSATGDCPVRRKNNAVPGDLGKLTKTKSHTTHCSLTVSDFLDTVGTDTVLRELGYRLDPDEDQPKERNWKGIAADKLGYNDAKIKSTLHHTKGDRDDGHFMCILREMKAEGLTLGDIVEYFSRPGNRREDVLELIFSVHFDCRYCSQFSRSRKEK